MLAPADQIIYGLGYYRISGSKEQRDSALSIPAQESHILQAMEREGVIFLDADSDVLTGKRSDRRGYQRMLAVARRLRAEGKQVAIFVIRLDRFGRDLEERTRAWRELLALGARMYSVRQGGWVKDSFLYNIDSVLSQREIEVTADRVKDSNGFIRANGFPAIGRVAWGYRLRDATPEERTAGSGKRTLEPDPVAAPLVRRAFELRAEGASLHRLHDWALTLSDAERGGRQMDWQMFDRLFKAPVYVARPEYPKGDPRRETPVLERPRGKWEPLVPDDLWARCAEQVERGRRMPRQASGRHLLTGLIRCERCGNRMGGSTIRRRYRGARVTALRTYPEYRCHQPQLGLTGRAPDEPKCNYAVPTHAVDAIVVNVVKRVLAPYDDPRLRARMERAWEARRKRADAADDTPKRIAATEARLAKWRRAVGAAFAELASGGMTRREYDDLRVQASGEIDDCERELARLRAQLAPDQKLPPLAEVLAHADGVPALLDGGDVAAVRAVLGDYLETVLPVRRARGEYAVRFVWTPLGRSLLTVAAGLTGDQNLLHVDGFGQPNTLL